MLMFVRVLTALAVVAACVALPAFAVVESSVNAALAGVINARLSNDADNPYPDVGNIGEQHGSLYIEPTLTDGTFTIQGAAVSYSDLGLETGLIHLDSLTVSNGNVVINGYYPVVTLIQFSAMNGMAAANTPMITLVNAFSSDRLTIEVVDSSVAWSAAETTANTQVLFLMPQTLAGAAGVFALGVKLARASAVVGVVDSSDHASMLVVNNSVVAVDYAECDGCANGIIYIPSSAIVVQSNSLLRVSHIALTATPAPAVAVINAASGGISVTSDSLIVVENITSRTSSIFGGNMNSANVGAGGVALRYLDVKDVGATLGAGVSYTDVTVQSGSSELDGATHVENACPSACLNHFSLVNAPLSCNCTCGALPTTSPSSANATMSYRNFCTLMVDPLSTYYPKGCTDGCIWCHNETACNTCSAGWTLNSTTATCTQTAAPCPANCATCNAAGVCTACNEGYAISTSGACVRCTTAGCKQCSTNNPNVCTLCQDNSAPINNVCASNCTVPYCVSCPVAPDTCARCADNYGLVNGTCSPVECRVADCVECITGDPTKCARCAPPKIVDTVTFQCITSGSCSVSHCKTCSPVSASVCDTCDAGYTLSADKTTARRTSPPPRRQQRRAACRTASRASPATPTPASTAGVATTRPTASACPPAAATWATAHSACCATAPSAPRAATATSSAPPTPASRSTST
ncbi:surface antigen-like protein [Leptomonas pyrrhocoris]|uniref:Surface antigen-like protein n=1 Tax=Leptomonas pyrrhocoris TaxID=157538 RepID=A0A0N0DS45_LEPPY|nr:surface antigen-like protein [Leptomonas pyrrhocoris]KPA75441.1 surface antigen-like protein [Leptomonas pyrrhocoris]|eukprot:XP_015653880.1 surface antigen-like protein [Leptomonas pyrrhocoris]